MGPIGFSKAPLYAVLKNDFSPFIPVVINAVNISNWILRHPIFLVQIPPRQVICFLIAKNVLVVEIRILIEVHGKLKGPPTLCFVNEDLSGIKLWLGLILNPADTPDLSVWGQVYSVRPEHRAVLLV